MGEPEGRGRSHGERGRSNDEHGRDERARSGGEPERRYEHPIPSRDEIIATMEKAGGPMTLVALAAAVGIHTEPHRRALENRLKAMVRDGQLIRNRAREFCLTKHLDLATGRVIAHRDGFGFLRPDDGTDDIYIPPRDMRALWDGDRVAVRVSAGRDGRREGRVVEILERTKTTLVGHFRRERGIDYVIEEGDRRAEVLIARGEHGGARIGDLVHVEIVEQPTERSLAIGRVIKIVGRIDEPGIETEVAILAHGIPSEWPGAVTAAARRIPPQVTVAAKRGREDVRKVPLVTIDGPDAKDFDDAVYCEPHAEGWKLLVAIADVSHYVEPDTPLDHEAEKRGTSVYFPDRVVPMLPEELSNGLCSLNPHVDRLCLACEMIVSRQGQVKRSRFFNGVMRSAARLTYNGAAELLESAKPNAHAKLRPELLHLRDVYRAFAKARRRRGSIDFDLPETKIELDERGKVRQIRVRERLETHRLIEECMIAANVEAAKWVRKKRVPALYRVHEGPEDERLEELTLFLSTFGFKLPPRGKLTPKDLARIIERVAGRPEAELVETVVLRSMKQARYQPRNVGHFGLGLPAYAHFTSPIRRYPDLLLHRAIRWTLGNGAAKGFPYSMPEMERLGEHCSRTERRADEAVWDVEEQLKCLYMASKVGEDFKVIVSSVVPFGLFVRIPELQVDGLVHVTSLPRDYYHRDPTGTRLQGERTGTTYRLTDPLLVRLVGVDVDERKIDFVPIERIEGDSRAAPAETQERRGRRRRARA
ncbi:MAG TPA: ribonuclease R [Gammaproteobacteria bacterium]|nr:ribonuclease R [Gammaproteobacteria bacterium]